MSEVCLVKKSAVPVQIDAAWDSEMWKNAEEIQITNGFDRNGDYKPDARVKMLYDDEKICGLFQVKDHYILARAKKDQDSVCQDSCVEFFVKPAGAERYFNFEFNCAGILLLYHIQSLRGKNYIEIPPEDMVTIKRFHTISGPVEEEIAEPTTWYLGFSIPVSFFKKYSGIDSALSGQEWICNFTKCADRTSHPCWLSWQDLGTCNFHQPDKFGKLIFE